MDSIPLISTSNERTKISLYSVSDNEVSPIQACNFEKTKKEDFGKKMPRENIPQVLMNEIMAKSNETIKCSCDSTEI